MASNEAPNTPGASGSNNNNTMSDSPPKYVPQFSAATEMILKRIQSGATSSLASMSGLSGTPPGYEDMRRSVLQGMKTTTDIEIPVTPNSSRGRGRQGQGKGTVRSASTLSATPTNHTGGGTGSTTGRAKAAAKTKGRTGGKRKRARSEEEESEESDSAMSKLGGSDSDSDASAELTESLPKITQSGRQIVKPAQFVPAAYEHSTKKRAPSKKSQENALCKKCSRGHSPQGNMIVFCDGCNGGWHQMCHDPIVSEEAILDEASSWFCSDCSRKKEKKKSPKQGTSAPAPIPAPASAPSPVWNPPKSQTPIEETVAGISWEGRSPHEKREYLNSLPHPQLVSLLMQALVVHPNLPIFPPTPATHLNQARAFIPYSAPMPPQPASHGQSITPQPFPPSAISTAGLFSRAEANPAAPINFIRKIQGNSTPTSPIVQTPPLLPTPGSLQHSHPHPQLQHQLHQQQSFHIDSAPPTVAQQNGESRESTPASPPFPKAGTGLMAKLGPDEEDMDWLVDNNDFDAFSHVVFDENGDRTEENGVAVI